MASCLVIPKVLHVHEGIFKIVATNSVGTTDHTFELTTMGNFVN